MSDERTRRLEAELTALRARLQEREQRLEELQAKSRYLEALINGINEEIMVIDDRHRIQEVNQVFLDRYRKSRQEVLGRKCFEVVYGSASPCWEDRKLCPLNRAKKTRRMVEVTHVHRAEGSEPREFVRLMYPICNAEGDPEQFIEIARDITDYRRLIRKLRASEKKFRAILDTATDAILSIDKEHRIVLYNNAARKIFGYTRDEVLGRNLSMLVPLRYGDHARYVKRFLERRVPTVIGKTLSLTALRKSGEEFPIELGLSYLEIEEGVTFTAIIRDVSEQRQLEKKLLQSERLAAVGEAVAHVAHEIKNPLMIIGGFSHQIRKSLRDRKSIQKLDMIFDEVRRLENLVANIGDFTKEYRLVNRPTDINAVVRDVIRVMVEVYPQDRCRFRERFSPDLGEIQCDPDKLKQVFMNIIANGVEAMQYGGTITVQTEAVAGGVEIRINDEGVGMREEELMHIFEPFYTTRERGSGLGLAISYKIVAAHKGEIRAESKPGKGTTFTVWLPAG